MCSAAIARILWRSRARVLEFRWRNCGGFQFANDAPRLTVRTSLTRFPSVACGRQNSEEGPEVDVVLERQPQRQVSRDVITIAPPVALSNEIPGSDQFTHNALDLSLRNVQSSCDVAEANVPIPCDQHERVAVVGQESEVGYWV
jgi:hypothetical protein